MMQLLGASFSTEQLNKMRRFRLKPFLEIILIIPIQIPQLLIVKELIQQCKIARIVQLILEIGVIMTIFIEQLIQNPRTQCHILLKRHIDMLLRRRLRTLLFIVISIMIHWSAIQQIKYPELRIGALVLHQQLDLIQPRIEQAIVFLGGHKPATKLLIVLPLRLLIIIPKADEIEALFHQQFIPKEVEIHIPTVLETDDRRIAINTAVFRQQRYSDYVGDMTRFIKLQQVFR
mmetsp:Transcript_19457/g.30904  ORF Transcript_19457/g.30904 Transcript_19457/m.30904 type:complete len:232 (+) Transcript_19457:197-892(+)